MNNIITSSALLVGLSILAAHALAGPLTPPSGAVAPTHKTLTEVEPRIPINFTTTPGDADSVFRITAGGSYYLTANFFGAAGKHGIEIANSNVTIDLNGFTLNGFTAATLDGIVVTNAAAERIRVHNGTIINFGGDGIDVSLAPGSTVENVCVRSCGSTALRLGAESTAVACVVLDNLGDGIVAGTSSSVVECIARDNGGTGIRATIVRACAATRNDGNGIDGDNVSLSTAGYNAGNGIDLNGASAATLCAANGNSGFGFRAELRSLVHECVASFNGLGGITADKSTITGNVCIAHTIGTDAVGILLASGCRVEDNHCADNDRGFRATGTDNTFARNTATHNDINYFLAANNYYGLIADRRIPEAIAGTPPVLPTELTASTLGTTDPNANYAY